VEIEIVIKEKNKDTYFSQTSSS